ncbi:MAG: nucleotidyltransferase domain-containing protein [Candidatus Woesearchaeota archaeon]
MSKPSKENKLLEIFYNEPTRHWHFNEIVKTIIISQDRAAYWLKKFQKEELIKHMKEKGKMPYFIGNHESGTYRNKKKIYALEQLNKSGLLDYLQTIDGTVIIFGSIARSDWYKESDIDLFIYGPEQEIDLHSYERALNREIQIFYAHDRNFFEKYGEELIKNIVSGYVVKGPLTFLRL